MAFAGALLASLAVYQLARGRTGASPERMILAGVIVTTFLSSAIVFITTLMDATRIRSFTFWLLGDLSGATSRLLLVGLVVSVGGAAVLTLFARPLNLLMLGERDAFDLGVEVVRVRIIVFLTAGLLVGTSVASSGSVGYVGLVVPTSSDFARCRQPDHDSGGGFGGSDFRGSGGHLARTVIAPRVAGRRNHGVLTRRLRYLLRRG